MSVHLDPAALAPPHNLEAERSVLGAILLSDRALYGLVVEDGLRADDFYREQHRRIYKAMLDLYGANEPVDILTVTERLRQHGTLEEAGGEAGVHALAGTVPSAGNVRHYAQIVRDNALLRRLLTTSHEIQARVAERTAGPRDLVEQAERAILDVAHDDRQKDFKRIDDLLHDEIPKLERLSREHTALTGTASGFKDLDAITGGFQPGNLIVLAARPSMGKCLTGAAQVYDPTTGARRRLDDVVARGERGEDVWVATLGPDARLRRARASAFARSGRQAAFRLTTRLGRTIEATANHPLLTMEGWTPLRDLRPGDRLGVPRRLPREVATASMPDHELVLLAALIADGNLTQRTPRFCFGADSGVRPQVEHAAAALGLQLSAGPGSNGTATISAAPANPLTRICRTHGICGLRSSEKFVPEAVFCLDDGAIARFLGILFACDGHVYAGERFSQAGYTTISPRLARDVQHLLLRLGIVTSVRVLERAVYEGTETVAREVRVTGQGGLRRFCERISVPGKESKQAAVVENLGSRRRPTNVDTVPSSVWPRVLATKGDRPMAELSAGTGRPRKPNWHVGARGMSRGLLAEVAEWSHDAQLEQLATSDLWWDEVATIEPLGELETYDLTVPETHSFVADDVLVHNSALVANIAENAAIEHGSAVALFSLEMSESELAQRFVASQARMKGDDLRKGRVPEGKWSKIHRAAERLASAPLYVDDSSDIGILEVRAKARRLDSQHPGGLGLVIVDYLQLMRPEHGVESRVEQVGLMSRGLKILARELSVPVIALSQLSRAVEARTDKRPILSDLRESGQIEQDADVVMFIYREEYYDKESEREGEADLLIAKHRNGGLGDVVLTFQKEYPKFVSYAGERFAA